MTVEISTVFVAAVVMMTVIVTVRVSARVRVRAVLALALLSNRKYLRQIRTMVTRRYADSDDRDHEEGEETEHTQ